MFNDEIIMTLYERQLSPFKNNAEGITNKIQAILSTDDFTIESANELWDRLTLLQKQLQRIQTIAGNIRNMAKDREGIIGMSRCDNKGDDNA